MAANICGLFSGKIPGRKELCQYYIELSDKHLHIFEGNEETSTTRKHLRSLEVNSSDCVSRDTQKRSRKFTYDRGNDGKYSFICNTEDERERWMSNLQKLIHKRELLEKGHSLDRRTGTLTASLPTTTGDAPIPPLRSHTLHNRCPSNDSGSGTPPPPPPHKRDSGFVSSGWEVTHTHYPTPTSDDGVITHHKSNSGGATVHHATVALTTGGSYSADGKIIRNTTTDTKREVSQEEEDDLRRYQWYWGSMKRSDCEQELKSKGQVGNFVVRKNDDGFFIMSFWRKDTVHHHKILKKGDAYCFQKSAVEAEGQDIPDLLDIYMKHCTDKTIGPYGGELHPSYDQAWNPPDIDFDKFQKKLSDIKDATGKKRMFAAGPSADQHTYGGLTLQQMNKVIQIDSDIDKTKHQQHQQVPPPTSQAPVPTPLTGIQFQIKPSDLKGNNPPPPSPKKPTNRVQKSASMHKEPPPSRHKHSPGALPTPQSPKHNHPTGYVNMMIPPSPQQPRPHPLNGYNPSTPQDIDEEGEFDDEDQEVYVEPGKMDSEQQESDAIYQNHNFKPSSSKPSASYINMDYGPDSVYQNVTHQGAPHTPPRVKPKVKPRK